MGFGEYISMKQEMQYATQERKREEWEFEHYPEVRKFLVWFFGFCVFFSPTHPRCAKI
jgi:hypothetical protein